MTVRRSYSALRKSQNGRPLGRAESARRL